MNDQANKGKTTSAQKKTRRFIWSAGIALAVAATGALTVAWIGFGESSIDYGPESLVERGDLTISVTESGTLRNRDQVIVSNRVEGRTTILWIIDEGEMVEEGDLLVELDASGLEDRLLERELSVQNAEASYIRAQQELKVTRSRTQSEIDEAELAKRFAQLDFDKYTGEEGEYAQQLDRLTADIDIAGEELLRAEQKYRDSEALEADGFITPLELEGDRLAYERARVDLRLARGQLRLVEDYTYARDLQQFESDVQQAAARLERVEMTAHADIVQAEADYNARKQELARQKQQLDYLKEQLERCRIYAPAEGMVIYETSANTGRRGNREPLEAGQEVRERQELIYLPASAGMIAEVNVHESALDRISRDMAARITVDARPGSEFTGTVRRIAPMPDAQSIWLNPDLTVYSTQVEVDADAGDLRTGMSCQVEIIIQELEDVVFAPLQSVVRYGRRHFVYVIPERGAPVARVVEIGLDNNRVVHIKNGVEPGERVLLAPPLHDRMDDDEQEIPADSTPPEAPPLDQETQPDLAESSDSGQAEFAESETADSQSD